VPRPPCIQNALVKHHHISEWVHLECGHLAVIPGILAVVMAILAGHPGSIMTAMRIPVDAEVSL